MSGASFPRSHEGHDGWGISTVTPYSNGNVGIAIVIPSPAFDDANGGDPDIILLYVGTSDTGSSTAPEMAERLEGLITKLTAVAPDARLVVAQIVDPGSWSAALTDDFSALLPGIVDAHAAAGERVVLLDMNVSFDPSTMMASDDIHPNDAGYALMAGRWYSVIGALLPQRSRARRATRLVMPPAAGPHPRPFSAEVVPQAPVRPGTATALLRGRPASWSARG